MSDTKWKQVGSNFPPVFTFDGKGSCIEGRLCGIRSFPSKEYDRDNTVYEIENADGKVSVFGTGLLDYLMKGIEEGTLVRITYLGKETVKIGKKNRSVHQYTVETPQ